MALKLGSRARWTTVACLLVLGLTAAACDPVPSGGGTNPLTCLSRVAGASDYQAAFNQRGPVWSGGDGAVPVALPDGRVMWLFGDTETGPVANNRFVGAGSFVHNSLIVQTGTCFQPLLGGTAARPVEWFRNPAAGQYYWPAAGAVDPSGRSVHVFLLRVATVPGATEWAFTVLDARLATLSLPDLRVRSIVTLPVPSGSGAAVYGSSVVVAGGYAYVYGNRSVPNGWFPRTEQVVARVSASLSGPWQFWDGAAWSADAAVVTPMTFLRGDATVDDPPMGALTVIPYGAGWLGSAKRGEIISDDVSAWYAPSPSGPWAPVNAPDGRVATTSTDPRVGQFSYNGRVVVLPGSGATVVYSVNTTNVGAKRNNARLYGPRFVAPVALPAPATLAARR